MAESSNQLLRMNFLLVRAMYNSDFDEVLAERLREIFFLIKCIVIKGGLLISLGNLFFLVNINIYIFFI